VPVSELVGIGGERPARSFPQGSKRSEGAKERAERAAPAALEADAPLCDVRGLRAEDALREVERFCDQALRQGRESAVILHGHGTGALKMAVRDYLDESPYVRMFRPGDSHEGGDGVTVVAFRS
jgi:DNA mismatch repair protein MutS2